MITHPDTFTKSEIEAHFKTLREKDPFAPVKVANGLCTNIISNLDSLCEAFQTTGNDKLARRLETLSELLHQAQYFFDQTIFLDNRDRTTDAIQASVNLHQLAVALLNRETHNAVEPGDP